jgi:hypothetical protein
MLVFNNISKMEKLILVQYLFVKNGKRVWRLVLYQVTMLTQVYPDVGGDFESQLDLRRIGVHSVS